MVVIWFNLPNEGFLFKISNWVCPYQVSRLARIALHFYHACVTNKKMPRIPDVHRASNADSILNLTGGLIFLFVTSSVLVLGALCKYLRNFCRKVLKERRKKRSKRRRSKRIEQARGSTGVQRSASTRSYKSREGVVAVSPQFSIPSSRSFVIQQPPPDLSQGRTGKTSEERQLL